MKFTCLFILMFCASNTAFSQEVCSHVVKTSNPSALVTYLSGKYSEEKTEHLVILVQNYEMEQGISVLCEEEYQLTIERLTALLESCKNPDESLRLKQRINRIVLLNNIEHLIF